MEHMSGVTLVLFIVAFGSALYFALRWLSGGPRRASRRRNQARPWRRL